MTIILSILKILGIILLVVLAVAILLVLIVLLVPIRYAAEGKIEDPKPHEDPPDLNRIRNTASGWFSFYWLLHLIRGRISYPDDPAITIKILWFTVFRKEFGSARESSEENRPAAVEPVKIPEKQPEKQEEKQAEQTNTAGNTPKEKPADVGMAEEKPDSDPGPAVNEMNVEKPPREPLDERIEKWIEAVRYRWISICDKIKHIRRNFNYYWKIISSPEFSDALALILRKIKKLLPGKWSAEGTLGLGDPEKAGTFLEVLGMTYPVTGGHVNIVPEFYQYQMDLAVSMKGKIRIITLVGILLDRNVRKVIRGFMRKSGKKEKK